MNLVTGARVFLMRDAESAPPRKQAVLGRLAETLENESVEVGEVARLIQYDPELAAMVLRLSNSAFFGQRSRSSSIQEAISRLGYREILKLVTVAAAHEDLHRELVHYPYDSDELWQLSLATALTMESFADRADVERFVAYSVGLLHAVGRAHLDQFLDEKQVDAPVGLNQFALSAWERETLGLDQADASSLLLRQWQLPHRLYQPIKYHYKPLEAGQERNCACLLHVACALAAEITLPESNSFLLEHIAHGIYEALDLSPIEIREEEEELRDEMSRIQRLFKDLHHE